MINSFCLPPYSSCHASNMSQIAFDHQLNSNFICNLLGLCSYQAVQINTLFQSKQTEIGNLKHLQSAFGQATLSGILK